MPSNQFFLRFLTGSRLAANATYGSEEYGSSLLTYGQEPNESALPSIDYSILPEPGFHPANPAWTFRQYDETRFSCVVVDTETPSVPIDVTSVVRADVLLVQLGFDKPWRRQWTLDKNEATNELYRDWYAGDLYQTGLFRVTIRIEFDSGRHLTVESGDEVYMEIFSTTDLRPSGNGF